ncbi:MAG TPA: hypothetical protein VGO11_17905 [Chthoniobacteraceae bacterium]|jgi:hypothetical protein|nr:hypothetical protein [Chthoniobacteraceae bacterium]
MKTLRSLSARLDPVTRVLFALVFVALAAAAGFRPAEAFWRWCAPDAEAGDTWKKQTVGELTLQSPKPFAKGPDVTEELPEPVRNAFAGHDIEQATDGPDFAVAVVRMVLKDGKQPNIDGAATGGMKQAIGSLGDEDPKFELTSTRINGLDARRGSYHKKIRDDSWHIESLVIVRDDTIWQVRVIVRGDARVVDATRVITSVGMGK